MNDQDRQAIDGLFAKLAHQAVFFGKRGRIGQETVEQGRLERRLEQPLLAVLGGMEQQLRA